MEPRLTSEDQRRGASKGSDLAKPTQVVPSTAEVEFIQNSTLELGGLREGFFLPSPNPGREAEQGEPWLLIVCLM